MIISASRRTDIPALYSPWFLHRIEEGFVYVRNPLNIHFISNITLNPTIVDCIVFWTKNATPMIKKLPLLNKYSYYFQYTINNYPRIFEPNIPEFTTTKDTFISLSKKNGKNKLIWRYDPIILTNDIDIAWHVKNFNLLCKEFSGYTNKCVISFVDFYKKTKENLKVFGYQNIINEQMLEIAWSLNKIANSFDIKIESCAEKIDLESIGIRHGKCIDDKLIEEIMNSSIKIEKDKNQREECGCVASIDIGAYNSCTNGCKYCYANSNIKTSIKNFSLHDTNSPLLFGQISPDDKVVQRECFSCRVLQKRLF